MQTHVVIMAGGIGSRFWPMSTPEYPKQFIDVTGCGKSLIQLTVERFLPLCRKHSKKCTFYTLRFGCSFAAVNTIKPQLL